MTIRLGAASQLNLIFSLKHPIPYVERPPCWVITLWMCDADGSGTADRLRSVFKAVRQQLEQKRHLTQVHQVNGTSTYTSASERPFPLRRTVNELMNGNFAKPGTELRATISELAPDITTHKAEILLSVTAATASWVAGMAECGDALKASEWVSE